MDTIDPEIAKDIAALQAVRSSRLEFNLRIVEASEDQGSTVLNALRSDAAFQLAEFFYLRSGFNITTSEEFEGLLERHNAYLSKLLEDPVKLARMGLSRERVLRAIFDGETRPRVIKVWNDDPGTIDQSSLARLLVAVMSDETARKTIIACEKAGFLERRSSALRLVLVRSRGILEVIYGDCLRRLRLAVEGLRT